MLCLELNYLYYWKIKEIFKELKIMKKNIKTTFFQRSRNNFFTGLIVITPIMVTAYIIWTLINYIDTRIIPLIPNKYDPSNLVGQNIPGLGVLIFLVFTTIVGALAKGFFGKRIVLFTEKLFSKTPIVRTLYNALKQIIETVLNNKNNNFKNACLIEYPRKGIWIIAFVATDTFGEVKEKINEGELLSVFVPTTPNPTSGFIIFVPKKDVIILDMNLEEAAKLVISAGLVVPNENNKNNKTNR